LAAFAFALIPVFVLLTRRVGDERRRIARSTQETLADISSLVQESLSVSGILLGKTMGRTGELADRFDDESRLLADLEVRQRMAGRWMMAMIQTTFAVNAGRGLLVRRPRPCARLRTPSPCRRWFAFTTLQTRLFFPVGLAARGRLDVQTSSRCSSASSTTSTSRSTSPKRARSSSSTRATSRSETSGSLRRRCLDAAGRLVRRSAGSRRRSSARPALARPRSVCARLST